MILIMIYQINLGHRRRSEYHRRFGYGQRLAFPAVVSSQLPWDGLQGGPAGTSGFDPAIQAVK